MFAFICVIENTLAHEEVNSPISRDWNSRK